MDVVPSYVPKNSECIFPSSLKKYEFFFLLSSQLSLMFLWSETYISSKDKIMSIIENSNPLINQRILNEPQL
jgi:hypothetical protein